MTPPNSQIGSKPRSRRSALVVSISIMIALVVVKTLCENMGKVRELEEWTYQRLLKLIAAMGPTKRPQVLVIDIGEIKPERWERDGRSDVVTPREPLERLTQIFADLEARSIGIDVDFSPENERFVHPDDPESFKRWLGLSEKKKIPILLGVYRTYNQPYKWLGDDSYMRLAALIGIPSIKSHDQAPHWMRVPNGTRLRSMSAGLAGVDVNAGDSKSRWSWAVTSTSLVKRGPDVESKETTIDYSPLPWIRAEVLPVLDAGTYAKLKDKIKDRMVIMGDREPPKEDLFQTSAGLLPGVYVHACAANTIATEPLYRLTLRGRIAVDLGLALAIYLFVKISVLIGELFRRGTSHAENRLNVVFTGLVIVFVALVSTVFLKWTRLLWTDFILVCLVLLVQLAIDIFRSKFSSAH
jgi:CHASE2 domain